MSDDSLTVLTQSYNPVSFTAEGMRLKNYGLFYKASSAALLMIDACSGFVTPPRPPPYVFAFAMPPDQRSPRKIYASLRSLDKEQAA